MLPTQFCNPSDSELNHSISLEDVAWLKVLGVTISNNMFELEPTKLTCDQYYGIQVAKSKRNSTISRLKTSNVRRIFLNFDSSLIAVINTFMAFNLLQTNTKIKLKLQVYLYNEITT